MKICGLTFAEIKRIKSGMNISKFNTDLFSFIYYTDVGFGCAMIVKKKLIKLAVKRNKIRRRIRCSLDVLSNYGIKCMIIAKKCFELMDFQSICTSVNIFFNYISRKIRAL